MFCDQEVAVVDDLRSFSINIEAHDGRGLLVTPPPAEDPAAGARAASIRD
jgi:hypothetical protein